MDHIIEIFTRWYALIVGIPVFGIIMRYRAPIKDQVMFLSGAKKRIEVLESKSSLEHQIKMMEVENKRRELELLHDKQQGYRYCGMCGMRMNVVQHRAYPGTFLYECPTPAHASFKVPYDNK